MDGVAAFEEIVRAYDRTRVRRVEAFYEYLDDGRIRERTNYQVDVREGEPISLVALPSRRMEIQVGMQCELLGQGRLPLVSANEIAWAARSYLAAKGVAAAEIEAITALFRGGWDCDDDREAIRKAGARAGSAIGTVRAKVPDEVHRFLRRTNSSFSKGSYVPFARTPSPVQAAKGFAVQYSRDRPTRRRPWIMATTGMMAFNDPIQIVPHGSFHWKLDAPEDLFLVGSKAPANWPRDSYRSTRNPHGIHTYASPGGKKSIMDERKKQGITRHERKYNWLVLWRVPWTIRLLLVFSAWYFALLGQALLDSHTLSTAPVAAAAFVAAALVAMVANSATKSAMRPFVVANAFLILFPILIVLLKMSA